MCVNPGSGNENLRIAQVRNTPGMEVKAKAVANAMRREQGVAEAVRLVGQTFGRA